MTNPMKDPWDERYIFLDVKVDFYGISVGKYTVRPMDLFTYMNRLIFELN